MNIFADFKIITPASFGLLKQIVYWFIMLIDKKMLKAKFYCATPRWFNSVYSFKQSMNSIEIFSTFIFLEFSVVLTAKLQALLSATNSWNLNQLSFALSLVIMCMKSLKIGRSLKFTIVLVLVASTACHTQKFSFLWNILFSKHQSQIAFLCDF